MRGNMLCPACGHEERSGTVCSQCATPFPVSEEEVEAASSTPSPPKKTTIPHPAPPKEGKHRPRPLHDLDLTLPELEVQDLERPKPEKDKGMEKPSFAVSDRRQRFENSDAPSDSGSMPRADSMSDSQSGSKSGNRVDFSSFVLSIAASALMTMGEAQVPGISTAQGVVDLGQARELINLLGLLEEKTKGNLTPEESEVLQQTLYTLRVKFIKASKKT
jgi:Domain of unknown function (DUF1844)